MFYRMVHCASCAPADGLSTAQVATITDTIVKETDYTAPQIKVIEVKADAQDAQ